jgi:hypothetical protein
MRRTRMMGLCLIAVLGMSIAAATPASAWFVHRWKTGGTYTVHFLWHTWTITVTDEIALRIDPARSLAGNNIMQGVELHEEGEAPGIKCHSTGAKEGEVRSESVTEELGFINKAKGEVGIEERPQKGELLEKFTCGEHVIETRGAVIGAITPINKKVTPEEHFTVNESTVEGKQAITKFEGGPTAALEAQVDGSGFQEATAEDPGEIVPAGTREIRATPLAGPEFAGGPQFYTKTAVGTIAAPVPFTGTLGAAFVEGAVSKAKIECTGGTATGEVTDATTIKGNATTFTGCKTGGLACESGATEGVIQTKVLEGALGALTATTVGLRLYSEEEGTGGKVAEFSCAGGAVAIVVRGSVVGSLSGAAGTEPANGKFASSNKLTFAEAGGLQKYTHFEGEAAEQLESSINGGAYEKSGQSVIETLKSTPAGNLGFTK